MVSPVAESLPKGSIASTKKTVIHVLHVDDDAGYLKTAKMILKMQDSFYVETVSSVEEAMEKMEEKMFDVIICDYIMPGKDGLEFLKELRDSGNSIPFIIFTGKGREIVAIKALNLGADQYVNKIGKPEAVYSELAHGICTVVKGKKAEEALRESEKEKSAILDSMSELVSHQDLKHRILWVNRKAADSVNMKAEQLKGHYCHELWAKSVNPCTGCPIAEIIKTGQPQQGEITTPDGRVWSISGYPIKDANGNVTSVVEVVTTITEQKKAEEELRKSEAKYRALVENIGNGIATTDLEGRFVFVNQALCEMIGYSEKELIGKPFADFLHPDDKKKILQIFLDSWKNPNKKISIEFRVIHKKGHIIHMYSSPTATLYKNKIVGFNAILSDITKHKLTEKALQESEENYRRMIEQAPDLIVTIDEKGIVTSCNPALERGTDYFQHEIIGKHFIETPLLYGIDPAYAQRLFNAIIEEKHPEPIELTWFLKDGTPRISDVRIGLMKKDGKITGFTAVARDITERKKAEDALRESEEKYRELLNGMNDTAWVIDFDGKFIDVNDAAVRVLGYSREELLSMGPQDIDTALTAEEIKGLIKGMPADEIQVFETAHTTKDGKKIPVEISSSLVTYQGKQAILSIARDITERKWAEEKLRQSEEKYRTVFENTGTAMCIVEKDKTISMVNRRFEELSGYSHKEIEGKKWTEFVTKEYLERMKRYHEARRKRGGKAPKNYNFDFVNKKGQIRNCLLAVNMIPETKKSVASILDITESKKTEKALLEAEEKHRETIVNANVGIIGYSPEGEVKVLNPKMEQMTGFKRSEIPTLQDWFKKLYPNEEERRKIRDKWFKRMSEEGEVKEGHAIITTKDGKRRNFLFNGVRLESGDSIAFADDITERKEAEEKLDEMMNELVTINEKLGVVGKLTRHDARNKLSVIANNIYLAKQKLAANHGALEYLGDMESAIDQMEKIFDFARTYEMLGVEKLSYMNVEKSVDDAAILFSGLAGAKLMNECQGLTVMADSLLRQLFYNLIDDTLKHGEKVSQIRVYYEKGEDQLKLVYEDDGIGIADDEKEKIFKEGYGKGTGYGLYLIKKMCETYSWTIRETGKPGKGAQFTMTIPKTNKNGKISYIIN